MNLEIPQNLGLWAYFLLGLVVMVEGPIATLAGAVAASSGILKPGWVFFAASAGNLMADVLWYFLGYVGNTSWLTRYGRWVGLKPEHVARMQTEITDHAPRLLLLAKLTMGFVIPTLVATGMARVPLRRWVKSLIVGETIWTGVLVLLGLAFGQYVQTIENGMQAFIVVSSGVFLAIISIYLLRKRQGRSAK